MSKAKALKEYVKKIQVIEFNFDWTAVMETLSGWAQCWGGGGGAQRWHSHSDLNGEEPECWGEWIIRSMICLIKLFPQYSCLVSNLAQKTQSGLEEIDNTDELVSIWAKSDTKEVTQPLISHFVTHHSGQ